ncbi:MAG TPA: STAS domain-containing protein [Ramlibacter sp.]|uniref:STAS domain-containing protein n=1 Tax=Ramlibacter sp. TaxID=1917967 RepID=UPI002ED064E7
MELVGVSRERGVAVVAPTVKRLDASVAPAFKQAVVQLVEGGDTRIVLDLAGVEFLDSSGLGAMVSILKNVGNRGAVAVCNARGAVQSLFQLTRMDKVFSMHGNREDAIARLAA